MGYYTKYDLTFCRESGRAVFDPDYSRLRQEIYKSLARENPNCFNPDENMDLDLCLSEEMKWYDHERDMCAVSSDFPDLLFSLWGEGEDSDDRWVKYFLNGKCQTCYAEIIYPPFNPEYLENSD